MPKSLTKLSNIQTVNFKLLVSSYQILVFVRCVFEKGVKKIDGKCFCKYYNIFFVPHVMSFMGNAFVKIAIYFYVTHAMSFTNKCHLCKIIEFYKDQGCQSDIQSCQLYRRLYL